MVEMRWSTLEMAESRVGRGALLLLPKRRFMVGGFFLEGTGGRVCGLSDPAMSIGGRARGAFFNLVRRVSTRLSDGGSARGGSRGLEGKGFDLWKNRSG